MSVASVSPTDAGASPLLIPSESPAASPAGSPGSASQSGTPSGSQAGTPLGSPGLPSSSSIPPIQASSSPETPTSSPSTNPPSTEESEDILNCIFEKQLSVQQLRLLYSMAENKDVRRVILEKFFPSAISPHLFSEQQDPFRDQFLKQWQERSPAQEEAWARNCRDSKTQPTPLKKQICEKQLLDDDLALDVLEAAMTKDMIDEELRAYRDYLKKLSRIRRENILAQFLRENHFSDCFRK